MHYDPVKRRLNALFSRSLFLKKTFYRMLDILLLRAWYVHKEIRFIRKQVGAEAQVLDAGAGLGQYVWYMLKRNPGWDISAVDISEEHVSSGNAFLEKARKYRGRFDQMDLTKLNATEEFDFILCVDVMEHIEDDQQVLEHFYRALRSGGYLLISTPSDQGGSDVHHEGESSFIEEHVRDGYNMIDLEEKLQQAGFQCVNARYTYGWPGNIAWRLSMKIPIQLLNVHKLFLLLLPLYYLPVMPIALLFNMLDTMLYHKKGTGLIVRARKIEHENQK